MKAAGESYRKVLSSRSFLPKQERNQAVSDTLQASPTGKPDETPALDAGRATLAELGLQNVTLVADPGDAVKLEESPGNRFSLRAALKLAIDAYLTDTQGSPDQGGDAPLGLITTAPDMHGLAADASVADASAKLRSYLAADPQAVLALLTPNIVAQERFRFTPEYGESLADNWVFRIILPTTLNVLTWVVVDKTGERPAYSYCIE